MISYNCCQTCLYEVQHNHKLSEEAIQGLPLSVPRRPGHQPQHMGVSCPGPSNLAKQSLDRGPSNREQSDSRGAHEARPRPGHPPPPEHHPPTHVPYVGETSGLGLACLAIFGPQALIFHPTLKPWSSSIPEGRRTTQLVFLYILVPKQG